MSCGIIKGDRLTRTGGCGRSRSYHAEFPTWLLGRAGRSAERDGVFSDEKEDSLFSHFCSPQHSAEDAGRDSNVSGQYKK